MNQACSLEPDQLAQDMELNIKLFKEHFRLELEETGCKPNV